MALKLPDSAVPMGDFPVAKAVDIDFNDGENLQEKLDNGKLGGSGGGASTYTSLEALGLTTPVTVGEIFNAMTDNTIAMIGCEDITVHTTDVPTSYGILTIKKKNDSRFSIEYQNSFRTDAAANLRKWIGTLKGSDGTGLYWKELVIMDKIEELSSNLDDLFQSVSSGKTSVANAITDKGVSTATDATFATMASNISKISGGYKEETKSKTFSTTGISVLTITFSANVLAIKQIIAPSDSCSILLQSSKNIFTINGKELIVHVTGGGTWSFTALIQN